MQRTRGRTSCDFEVTDPVSGGTLSVALGNVQRDRRAGVLEMASLVIEHAADIGRSRVRLRPSEHEYEHEHEYDQIPQRQPRLGAN